MILLNYYITINNYAEFPCPILKQGIKIINFYQNSSGTLAIDLIFYYTFYWNNNAKKVNIPHIDSFHLRFVVVQEVYLCNVPLKTTPAALSNNQPEK